MPDRISNYRVVRFSLFPPSRPGGGWRWAIVATGVRRGIPSATILLDGHLPGGDPLPTLEEILEAYDAALRSALLPR